MSDKWGIIRKKMATIDCTSWEEEDGKCYAAIELWIGFEMVDEAIFGPYDTEDEAWDEAIDIFWDSGPRELLAHFREETQR